MKNNSNIPAFLTKLWTLVEDADTNEFICWSQEGHSFLVLDEQRFAKEILPKFYKHNNMASFVRQLNMYGFRKVMHVDTGIVKQEKDGPVEFQHPYFKHDQDDLLENIKRKVSNTRPEESKLRQEDLTKILVNVQNLHGKQESMDARMATLQRENEALWRDIADLRQKHAQQQQLIKKLIHFIVTLVQNNRILNLKRTRPILMNSNGKKPKYIHQIYKDKSSVNSLSSMKSSDISDEVIICDVTDEDTEVLSEFTESPSRVLEQGDVEIVEVELDSCTVLPSETEITGTDDVKQTYPAPSTELEEIQRGACLNGSITSNALQLNKPSGLSLEDPVNMMDSILNESGAISQNISLLGKMELMDYLDSIDCSLEDFQAMLYGKQFSIDPDAMEESMLSRENSDQLNGEDDHNDKRLIQYTSCPLLAFLDGCPTPTPSLACPSSSVEAQPPTDLLEPTMETEAAAPPPRGSLLRLEPLSEASEEPLFYLLPLSPDSAQLDVV